MKKLERRGGLALLLSLTLLVAFGTMAPVQGQPRILVQGDATRHAGEFVVPVNKSQVLQLDVPFTDLLVGNSEIADVLALTDRTVYVLGKALGSTSLTIYGTNKNLIAVVDLVISPDIEGLKARLFEIMPNENIEARTANGSVMLSGTVSSAAKLDDVMAIADRFAPGLVTNLVAVEGSQQVMLKVKFVDIQRTAAKQLGLNLDIVTGDFSFTSGNTFLANPDALRGTVSQFPIDDINAGLVPSFDLVEGSFAAGLGGFRIGNVEIQSLFEALENKGLSKTLAEPNLIALSGDTADFLAGGEFPIQVVEDDDVSIEFKRFGISLAFTPTVLDDGLINLVVAPEVSSLGPVVTANGIPSLLTRKASTTVELRDGQSFAIAGLIQDDFRDSIDQVPILADIPILGALLRSSEFDRTDRELVIIVEPHLVRPAPAGSLATPADNFIPPSDIDMWLFGRIEALGSGMGGDVLGTGGAGGIEGHFGHIIQ
jgi:pilus assembly protein CpaC